MMISSHGRVLTEGLRTVVVCLAVLSIFSLATRAHAAPTPAAGCHIDSRTFDSWNATEISNQWVTLTIVPQLGGRLMQVEFGGHAFLFVNPAYLGQYHPPSERSARQNWFNYGGDKIWPLPEGAPDGHHWPGPIADNLDDGVYALSVLSRDSKCAIRLEGPADPHTGLQYARDISIGSDSPKISFHAVMKNSANHPIEWSMQSVTQYNTSDSSAPGAFNHNFWAFAPANPSSAYFGGYRVRFGLANDPSFSITDNLFTLHWLCLQSEVWLDSTAGWLAVVDGATNYAMAERFHPQSDTEYPEKATVIFYKNGPGFEVDELGAPRISSDPDDKLFYMEAEVNSPIVRLEPGATYALDTEWFPTRIGAAMKFLTDAGLVSQSLAVSATASGVEVRGDFGVFFPGKLAAHLYDERGDELGVVALAAVTPLEEVILHKDIPAPQATVRVAVHLVDREEIDRGILGEARVNRGGSSS